MTVQEKQKLYTFNINIRFGYRDEYYDPSF